LIFNCKAACLASAFFKGGKGSIPEGNFKSEAESSKSDEKNQMTNNKNQRNFNTKPNAISLSSM